MYIEPSLIQKYNVPVPRYTSYPTVPFWDNEKPSTDEWFTRVKKVFDETNEEQGISMYIHLPFCESLCTYCGCNTRITKNHKVEEEYIETLLTEWRQYLAVFSQKPVIRELHLGGGTPTFFSPENLKILVSSLLAGCEIHTEREFSFEGHPNNTTKEHLQALYDVGFRRVSYGIQDLDLKVQQTINRVQPYANVEKATQEAREVGYESVNFDLIYGLPYQNTTTIADTIQQIAKLQPDRIAYYSYAHVPWIKPGQRSYDSSDLPDNQGKRRLYEIGKELLTDLGYIDVGMDHFALKHDPLYRAMKYGRLHRNFMGYTTSNTHLLIGLGTSAISDAHTAYAQNLKKVEDYKVQVQQGNLPIFKGHMLTEEDLRIKELILDISCNGYGDFEFLKTNAQWPRMDDELSQMEREGLIVRRVNSVRVTVNGKAFIRNICKVFDVRLGRSYQSTSSVFSKSI